MKNYRFLIFLPVLVFLGCATASVKDTKGPSIAQVQAVSPVGPKARIAVAPIENYTQSTEVLEKYYPDAYKAYMEKLLRQTMAEDQSRSDRHAQWMAYYKEMSIWLAKVEQVGKEKAGPPPPKPETLQSSPYGYALEDPVATGVRQMLTTALFNSGKYIVLERKAIDLVNWEQEFSRSDKVKAATRIPKGQLEGVEFLILGSLTAFEPKESGGSGVSDIVVPIFGKKHRPVKTETGATWETAYVAMDLRVVDTRTARVVSAMAVEGRSLDAWLGTSKAQYTSDAGPIPAGIAVFQKTPVEEALRKMVDKAVEFLMTKTPDQYYHY